MSTSECPSQIILALPQRVREITFYPKMDETKSGLNWKLVPLIRGLSLLVQCRETNSKLLLNGLSTRNIQTENAQAIISAVKSFIVS